MGTLLLALVPNTGEMEEARLNYLLRAQMGGWGAALADRLWEQVSIDEAAAQQLQDALERVGELEAELSEAEPLIAAAQQTQQTLAQAQQQLTAVTADLATARAQLGENASLLEQAQQTQAQLTQAQQQLSDANGELATLRTQSTEQAAASAAQQQQTQQQLTQQQQRVTELEAQLEAARLEIVRLGQSAVPGPQG